MIGTGLFFLISLVKDKPLCPGIIISKIKISKLIISNFALAAKASLAVETKKLFSSRYCFTNSLILSSSSTTIMWHKFLFINDFI